jgi:hypothetical protein
MARTIIPEPLLQTSIASTAAGLLTDGLELVTPPLILAQDVSTPDAALAELMSGNKRFTSGGMRHYEYELAVLKQHTEEKQEPSAAVLF